MYTRTVLTHHDNCPREATAIQRMFQWISANCCPTMHKCKLSHMSSCDRVVLEEWHLPLQSIVCKLLHILILKPPDATFASSCDQMIYQPHKAGGAISFWSYQWHCRSIRLSDLSGASRPLHRNGNLARIKKYSSWTILTHKALCTRLSLVSRFPTIPRTCSCTLYR